MNYPVCHLIWIGYCTNFLIGEWRSAVDDFRSEISVEHIHENILPPKIGIQGMADTEHYVLGCVISYLVCSDTKFCTEHPQKMRRKLYDIQV